MSERLEISIVSKFQGKRNGREKGGGEKARRSLLFPRNFHRAVLLRNARVFRSCNENRSSVFPLLPAVRFAISFDTPKVIIYTYVCIFMYTRGMA